MANIWKHTVQKYNKIFKDIGSNGEYILDNLVAGAQYSLRVTEEDKEPTQIEFNTKPAKLSGKVQKFLGKKWNLWRSKKFHTCL